MIKIITQRFVTWQQVLNIEISTDSITETRASHQIKIINVGKSLPGHWSSDPIKYLVPAEKKHEVKINNSLSPKWDCLDGHWTQISILKTKLRATQWRCQVLI